MKHLRFYPIALAFAAVTHADVQHLSCFVGPVTKVFGSLPWLVYSCSDGRSLVLVSAPGSPAAPFHFLLLPAVPHYHVDSGGTGSKALTDAALKELSALPQKQIEALIVETRAVKKKP